MPKKQQDQDEHTQGIVGLIRLLSGRSGAAGAAALQGRQAQRGGDSPQGFPLECKRSAQRRRRESIDIRRSKKKGYPDFSVGRPH